MLHALLLISLAEPSFKPPFERISSIAVKGYGDTFTLVGDTAYIVDGEELLVVDLNSRSKRTLYRGEKECWIRQVAAQSGQLYAIVYSRKTFKTQLVILNEKSGKQTAILPLQGDAKDVVTTASQVFVSKQEGDISGLDIKTHKPRWTTKLSTFVSKGSEFDQNIDSLTINSGVLLCRIGSVTVALDANKGTILWSQPNSYTQGEQYPVSANTVFVPMDEGVAARDLRTGKSIWISEKLGSAGESGVWQGDFFTLDENKISLLDGKTGTLIWNHPTQSEEIAHGIQYASVINNQLYVAGRPHSGIYRKDGSVVWQGNADDSIPKPVWSNGTVIATWSGDALSFYKPGQTRAMPTSTSERQALAKKLAERIAVLDKRERDQLVALGDDAFTALLSATVRELDKDRISLVRDRAIHLLEQVTLPKRTPEIIAAIKKLDTESDPYWQLIGLLGEKGEPSLTESALLDAINRKPGAIKLNEDSQNQVTQILTRIPGKRAIEFSIKLLDDSKADSFQRLSAYMGLASTGSEQGLAAILRHRQKQTDLPKIIDRLYLENAEKSPDRSTSKLIKKAKSTDGRTFGLFASAILGGYGDLWIAEFKNEKWVNAYFLGIAPPYVPPRQQEERPTPQRFAGKTADQLIKGDWVSILADNPELSKDSDQDGLTDIMEERLGTNPNSPDTDGDGKGDEIDPWPTTVTRTPETDEEKILALAFEVMIWESAWICPGVITYPETWQNIELPGWPGPLYSAKITDNKYDFEFNAADSVLVRFGIGHYPGYDDPGRTPSPTNPYGIKWNVTRDEVTITLEFARASFSVGSYYTLRKIKGVWYVTDLHSPWIT